MFKDLREFVAACEARNDVIHVEREVDCMYEIGKALKKSYEGRSPVIYFENCKGKSVGAIAGVYGNREKALLALDATEENVYQKFLDGISNPIEPVMYAGDVAPCQEVVLMGDDIDLNQYPIPWFSPYDGGAFITAGITISKDPETGVPDIGHYRYQLQDAKTLGYMAQPFHRFGKNCVKARAMGYKKWGAAIVLGTAPAISYCGPLAGVSDATSDLALAGGLMGEPIELVKCKTVDVEVPAWAEYVIEIEVDFETTMPEGPLGEFTGYQTPASEKPVSRVTCITHRKGAYFPILMTGQPVTENHILKNIPMEASTFRFLKAQFPTVTAVNVLPAGGCQTEVVVSMKQRNYGDARSVILALMGSNVRPKWIVVVDEDIDVHNLDQVAWAIAYRCVPGRDTILVTDVPGSPSDPTNYLPPMKNAPDWSLLSKIRINGTLGIDATYGFGMEHEQPAVVPGWEDYDFPELEY
ncbi:MAG: UbiD family decarboxylase [Eggerthellaceae bacterium]|nr:UbiD family decarboxylase [Eggerthellaceae bacterium]